MPAERRMSPVALSPISPSSGRARRSRASSPPRAPGASSPPAYVWGRGGTGTRFSCSYTLSRHLSATLRGCPFIHPVLKEGVSVIFLYRARGLGLDAHEVRRSQADESAGRQGHGVLLAPRELAENPPGFRQGRQDT